MTEHGGTPAAAREEMRRTLQSRLDVHRPADPREGAALEAMRAFVRGEPDPFDRGNPRGHVTGSAVVCDGEGGRVLLVRHRKLARWLQPGGHTHPADRSVLETALREVREETGVAALAAPLGDEVLHVDVHEIPARGAEPPHLHYDVRYLLVASGGPPARGGDAAEVSAAAWFGAEELAGLGLDASLVRALARAAVAMDRVGRGRA